MQKVPGREHSDRSQLAQAGGTSGDDEGHRVHDSNHLSAACRADICQSPAVIANVHG